MYFHPSMLLLALRVNSRHGHVVIGGKGANGQSLSDAWVFNPVYQGFYFLNNVVSRNLITSVNSGPISQFLPLVRQEGLVQQVVLT